MEGKKALAVDKESIGCSVHVTPMLRIPAARAAAPSEGESPMYTAWSRGVGILQQSVLLAYKIILSSKQDNPTQ